MPVSRNLILLGIGIVLASLIPRGVHHGAEATDRRLHPFTVNRIQTRGKRSRTSQSAHLSARFKNNYRLRTVMSVPAVVFDEDEELLANEVVDVT